MLHKILDNDLMAIRKSKLALKLNKPGYNRMCILELSKALMYEFHYDYIKNKYDNKSKVSFTVTNISMYEIKTEIKNMKILAAIKKIFDFSNCSTKLKYYHNSNKLVTGKMKDEAGGFAIK